MAVSQILHECFSKIASRHPQIADFLCPITGDIMKDPVTAEDNFNYEHSAISSWLAIQKLSPQNKKPMGPKLVPNKKLKEAIQKFMAEMESPSSEQNQITWQAHGMRASTEQRSITLEAGVAAHGVPPQKKPRCDSNQTVTMSNALSKAFLELDPIRDLLSSVLDGWTPPKVVVIGDESSGKSTILEQLSMLPIFPRKKRFCTRSAIHVRLRRAGSINVTLSVYALGADGTQTLQGKPENMPQENGWIWVQERMLQLSNGLPTGIVEDKVIVLEVHRPDVPSIDLVDLPGLTAVDKKVSATEAVLKKQLENDAKTGAHSMYLAVVPAGGDVRPNTNNAMSFIQNNKLESNTFGVFSKCDQNLACGESDLLCSLVSNKASKDGDSPEALGAVNVGKGWVTTMLKPPEGEEFQVHNFERLRIQLNEDKQFFSKAEYKEIVKCNRAGIGALVERLEKEYSDYLNTTWKEGALKTVLKKLDEKEFELNLLGIHPDHSTKATLARQEIERRLGANSCEVQVLDNLFMKNVLLGQLCSGVRSALGALNGSVLQSHESRRKLESTQLALLRVAYKASSDMYTFWDPRLKGIISAESRFDESQNDIITEYGEFRKRLCGKRSPIHLLRRCIKHKPLIQLSHYPKFTEAVMANCKRLFADDEKDTKQQVHRLIQRLIDPDSPWLRLRPELATLSANAQSGLSGGVSRKVNVECDVERFLEVLVDLFQRRMPSQTIFQKLHLGVAVGDEDEAAMKKFELMRGEIQKIEAARDGIRKAFSISDSAFAEMKKKFDAEAIRRPTSSLGLYSESGPGGQMRGVVV